MTTVQYELRRWGAQEQYDAGWFVHQDDDGSLRLGPYSTEFFIGKDRLSHEKANVRLQWSVEVFCDVNFVSSVSGTASCFGRTS